MNASVVSVTNSPPDHNQAQGSGGGNAEREAREARERDDHNLAQEGGGNGLGGGIANLLSATTTVDSSYLTNNQANGDGGGAGLGGGAYNDATSTLKLTKSLVISNHANGKPGIGGGIYNLGTFFDVFTVIAFNHASTSGDNIGP